MHWPLALLSLTGSALADDLELTNGTTLQANVSSYSNLTFHVVGADGNHAKQSSHRHSRTGAARPDAVPKEPAAARLNPLDRITEHLRHLGLGQSVSVHLEVAGTGFVLEDADGLVHAKDYDQAVTIIERIWLYQP